MIPYCTPSAGEAKRKASMGRSSNGSRDRGLLPGAWAGLALGGLVHCAPAWCTDVGVVGLFPNKAVVMLDGVGPKTVAVGQKLPGNITLVSVEHDSATFDIDGKRKTIRLGEAHSSTPMTNSSIALTADARGHYFVDAQVNSQGVRFMVDTGATLVTLSSGDAERLGLNYLAGPVMRLNTVNGLARAWQVRLDTLRIGGITQNNVEAAVVEFATIPSLLGMNVLNRMDMHQNGDTLTLTKR
jgi:aspartyl protease family protein